MTDHDINGDPIQAGSTTRVEWTVRLDGNLGAAGTTVIMEPMSRDLADVRRAAWQRNRPDVTVTLLSREVVTTVGEWVEAESREAQTWPPAGPGNDC